MELREKIAAVVSPREWTDGREASDLYAADRKRSLAKADAILAIPEIRDALKAYKPIYIFGDMTEETRNWPGKPDGTRTIKWT